MYCVPCISGITLIRYPPSKKTGRSKINVLEINAT